MDETISIRNANLADAATITDFNLSMAKETEDRQLDRETLQRGVQGLFANPARGFYLVAESGGRVVGSLMVTYEWSDWRHGDFWWIQSVYVKKDHRGQGIFRALYQEVQARARAASEVCGVRLYVDEDNLLARRVYDRLGMRETDYRLLEVDWT